MIFLGTVYYVRCGNGQVYGTAFVQNVWINR